VCGIAGIFAYHYAALPVDRDELRAVRDQMAARGPDGKGEWFSDDQRVALGHRRL
jgi:asparagine synthase (glutamine-hydrolysing)